MQIKGNSFLIAKELLEKEWNPIPILKGQKRPAVDWLPFQKRMATLEEITEWFYETDHEIAVVTGKISGITVIDLDKKENIDGEKTAIAQGLDLPVAAVRKSPNGIHHYIKYNPDIKQTQGILDGIDIRNDGGYIKFWDFLGKYHWLDDSDPIDYINIKLIKKIQSPIFDAVATTGNRPPEVATVPMGKRHDFIVKETMNYMKMLPTPKEVLKAVTNSLTANAETMSGMTELEISTTVNDVMERYKYDLNIKSIADIESRETEWLWHPYIPLNMVTLIAGMPSSMKSYFVIDLALRLSLKLPFASGETPKKNFNVLYFPVEDSLEQTIKTRIEKQGRGVPSNLFVSDKTLNLTKWDAQQHFKQELLDNQIDVVILDPISSFLGGKDTNSESNVRPVLEFLKSLESMRVTSLLIRHTNKGETQTNFDKVAGSGAWVQVVRSLLLVAKSQDERNKSYIKLEKNNLVADSEYMLELYNNDGVVELNQIPVDDDAFNDSFNNKDNETTSFKDLAMEYIPDYLEENSGATKQDIEEYCKSRGEINQRTVRTATETLVKEGIIHKQKGQGELSRKVFYYLSDDSNDTNSVTGKSRHLMSSESSDERQTPLIQQQDIIKKGEL